MQYLYTLGLKYDTAHISNSSFLMKYQNGLLESIIPDFHSCPPAQTDLNNLPSSISAYSNMTLQQKKAHIHGLNFNSLCRGLYDTLITGASPNFESLEFSNKPYPDSFLTNSFKHPFGKTSSQY